MYGDIFLKQLALNLRKIDEEMKIYRWGGDEILILEKVTSKAEIELSISKINEVVTQNWDLNGLKYSSTASIGIAIYLKDGESLEQVFSNLDITLNQAKIQGKSQHQYYKKEFTDDVRYKIAVESELNHALEEDSLELFFQPVFNLDKLSITGFEALLRWPGNPINESNIGNIINVAEETGQILKIDRWVIDKAFCLLHNHKEKFGNLNLAINISTQ